MGTAVESKSLLDMSQPIDVPLLDNTVQAFYGAGSAEEVVHLLLPLPFSLALPLHQVL